jgi:hypothetical protein
MKYANICQINFYVIFITIADDIFIKITTFVPMKNKAAIFKRFVYYRVIPKRCPIHNKQARISVTGMNYKVTDCCCDTFRKSLETRCCKYKYGILSGRYDFSPKSRLR